MLPDIAVMWRGGDGREVLTNAAGCHVCGNHDGTLAGLELVKNPITFVLLLVSVNG